MADDTEEVPNCNCTKTLWAVGNLRSDTEDYKTQVLIIHCVMAAVMAILAVSLVALFFWTRKLHKLVKALDPMSTYKKVGPSVYIKRAKRDMSSISSSFKHFNQNAENNLYSDIEDVQRGNDETLKKTDVGTLDRNFFTTNNFSFENPLAHPSYKEEQDSGGLNRRKISDVEAKEAISKLDKIIY